MTKNQMDLLSLDRPATYQIKVPGLIDRKWADYAPEMEITVKDDGDLGPVTTMIGELDQAALHGLLRRLYSMGLPLISVQWVEEVSSKAVLHT
jgi:hypothetical protein